MFRSALFAKHLWQLVAALGPLLGMQAGDPGPKPSGSGRQSRAPEYLILNGVDDLESLRRKLGLPDFVIIKGSTYDQIRNDVANARPALAEEAGVVEAVAVRGEVRDEIADLTIELTVRGNGGESGWVPIGLDRQVVTSAREGERELPLRGSSEGVWSIELAGAGRHRVQVRLKAPLSLSGDARRLVVAIPEAAGTSLSLVVDPGARDASTLANAGGDAKLPIEIQPIEGGQRSRIAAHLSPRRVLDVSWRAVAEDARDLPALLTSHGEVAVDLERGGVATRATFDIRCARGEAATLEFTVDPAEELLAVTIDDQPIIPEIVAGDAGAGRVIRLPEPLRPDRAKPVRVSLTSKRAAAESGASEFTFRGYQFRGFAAQTGLIGVTQGRDVWVSGTPGRGVRQIDPRTELSAGLRTRPSTVLAYQFAEQPFELGLRTDPTPAWSRVEVRATALVDPEQVRIDQWFDCSITRGRVFDVRISVPADLELDSVGPAAVVSSWSLQAKPSDADADTILRVRLSAQASEDGQFSLRVQARRRLELARPDSLVRIGLMRMLDLDHRGLRVAVLGNRQVRIQSPTETKSPLFSPIAGEIPANWVWPETTQFADATRLWFRSDQNPPALELVVSRQRRAVQVETTSRAIIERRRVDVRQETTCRVRHGTLSGVTVVAPRAIEGLWELEGAEVTRRERLGPGPGPNETIRERLTFAREISESIRLRFRIRVPFNGGLLAAKPTRVSVPVITVEDATPSAPSRITVATEPGVGLTPAGAGWTEVGEDDLDDAGGLRPRLAWTTGAGHSPELDVSLLPKVSLPAVVAPRAWLVSVIEPGGGVRTTAWYALETELRALDVTLPNGAKWIRAWVGDSALREVEQGDRNGVYRLSLPSAAAGGVVVGVEYVQPWPMARGQMRAPRLARDILVEECFWEIHVSASTALLGEPAGWSDENVWHWDWYVWKRRPRFTGGELARWLSGRNTALPLGLQDSVADLNGFQGYLFGRSGEPESVHPLIVPRALLVGICSGSVLAFGLLLLQYRPARWIVIIGTLATTLAACVLFQPSATIAAIQSAEVGVILVGLAVVTQAGLSRRRQSAGPDSERIRRNQQTAPVPPLVVLGSSAQARGEADDDESTVVRSRVGSTKDHIPAPQPSGLEEVLDG